MKKSVLISFAVILYAQAFSQNVGIGTTSPAAKLDVNSSSNYVGQFNGISPMYMSIFEGGVYRGYWGSFSGAPDDVDFGTGVETTGKLHLTIQALPKLTIANNGKVGIGTTSPAHLLHIYGGDLFVQSSHGVIRLGYAGGNEWQMATTGGGADLRWYTTTNGGTTIAPRHYFSQNGNVGIGGFAGVATPNARLEIIGYGNTSATNLLMLRSANGDTLLRFRDDGKIGIGYNGSSFGRTINLGGNGINLYPGDGEVLSGAIVPTDTSLILWSRFDPKAYLVFQPEFGNTGVGTYTPNAKFHVNGSMLIGSNSARIATGYALSVDGKIMCEDVDVLPSGSWPDYVFEEKYPLLPLEELNDLIQKQKHLPNIPSSAEVAQSKGVGLGEMNRKLLEKVEELTLYIIQLNKDKKQLEERVTKLEDSKN